MRVGRPWHRVPRAAVAAPGSLEVSKARLDIGAWSSLGQREVSLPVAGVALDELQSPFQPNSVWIFVLRAPKQREFVR